MSDARVEIPKFFGVTERLDERPQLFEVTLDHQSGVLCFLSTRDVQCV